MEITQNPITISVQVPAAITISTGEQLTEADIPAGIARDAEVDAKIAAALTGTTPQELTIDASHITGQLSDSQLPASIARDTEMITLIALHEQASNPHPQYSKPLEVTSAVNVGINAHVQATDPHPQYRLNSALVPAASVAYGALKGYRPSVPVAANKSFALSDAGTLQKCTNAATLTIELDSSINFETDTEIDLIALTTGTVLITSAVGVTIERKGTGALQLKERLSIAQLKKLSANYWILSGDLI